MTEIVLTILTGVHAGAEIRLPPGEYALGRAEDCDLILTDSSIAPRHCALLVPEKGGMSVRPLEGELTLDGTPCSALFTLPAAKPLLAGLVCLAWAYDGQSLRDITPPSLLAAPAGGSEKTQPETPPGTKDGPAGTDGAGDADPSPHPDSATRTAPRASSAAPVRLFRRVLPFGLLALLLSGLTIQFMVPGDGPNRSGLDLASLESALRVAGFSSLMVAG
ncbi:MAG: FHA domain-containing protein, partial [Deltaproteobacteria bacterium]|nr:FHA domain-containing protein [Deltaproteobacteria bacterium]